MQRDIIAEDPAMKIAHGLFSIFSFYADSAEAENATKNLLGSL